MKDKEIIKALECCPLDDIGGCRKIDALDLINRQKAEIKSLTEKLEALGDPLQDAQYKIAEKQAEIARLKEFIEKDQGLILHLTNVSKDEYDNKIKAEAIKDFAERLRKQIGYEASPMVCGYLQNMIDNLVKEMAGDA